MNAIKKIRTQLGLTQAAFGVGIGCTQANVGHYEHGHQSVPPAMATKIIEFVGTRGVVLTYNDIYQPSQDACAGKVHKTSCTHQAA